MSKNYYLSDKQVAARFGVSRSTPWRWAERGEFPAPVRLSSRVTRWSLDDVIAFELERREVAS